MTVLEPSTPQVMTAATCPACGSSEARNLDEFPVADLCAVFKKQLSVDVSREFPAGLDSLSLLKCSRCTLEFFHPLVSGSPSFYADLAGQKEYYSEARWEFTKAKALVASADSVLDVGCGGGFFLSQLPHASRMGLEFNPTAVARARQQGLNVRQGDVKDLKSDSFGAATLFHVVEHLVEPVPFLLEVLRVVKHNGLLLISVPNNDGFIGQDIQHAANSPPHHPLRWTENALAHLTAVLPIDVELMECEPLNRSYLFLYRRTRVTNLIGTLLRRRLPLMKLTFGTALASKLANALGLLSLRLLSSTPPPNAKGFSVLAAFRKR